MSYLYRDVLRAVVEEANRRCDGVLPTDLPGVGEVFGDELTLVGALQLRWHTRLAGAVEQAVEAEPGEPESAVVTAWRRTAQALPGVRAVLDARAEHPASEAERAALRTAESKDRALLAAMAGQWREDFLSDEYRAGCPVAASVVDCSAANPTVRQAASDAFAVWQDAVATALRGMHVPYRRARSLATLMIGALEGAILIARAERDPRALDVTVRELRPLLDAAVRNPPVPARPAGARVAPGRPRPAPSAARTRSGR